MNRTMDRNNAFFEKSSRLSPFGVQSNFRYWGEGQNVAVDHAEGAYLYDLDGNRYTDYRLGYGPIILGHSYPAVVDHVAEAIRHGTMFSLSHPGELRVCERLVRMCPGVQMVRFANSGSEATMHALRFARGYTGREKIIKFEGGFHGTYDYVMFSNSTSPLSALGYRRSPIPAQVSSGIPECIRGLLYCLPFNDVELLESLVRRAWGEIAAILVEPVLGNAAGILPEPGFLQAIRRLCDEYGIVMIMDEIKTGFRIARGGAQEVYGVMPDLATYAKAMANGFPIAAIGGRKEIMSAVGPGRISHAGTYTSNVVGTAAADATLELLEDGTVLDAIAARGRYFQDGIRRVLTDAGIPHSIVGHPAMFGIVLSETPPRDYRDWFSAKNELYERLMMALLDRGVMPPDPDGREPWFTSYSHTDADIDETLNRFADAVHAVKDAT